MLPATSSTPHSPRLDQSIERPVQSGQAEATQCDSTQVFALHLHSQLPELTLASPRLPVAVTAHNPSGRPLAASGNFYTLHGNSLPPGEIAQGALTGQIQSNIELELPLNPAVATGSDLGRQASPVALMSAPKWYGPVTPTPAHSAPGISPNSLDTPIRGSDSLPPAADFSSPANIVVGGSSGLQAGQDMHLPASALTDCGLSSSAKQVFSPSLFAGHGEPRYAAGPADQRADLSATSLARSSRDYGSVSSVRQSLAEGSLSAGLMLGDTNASGGLLTAAAAPGPTTLTENLSVQAAGALAGATQGTVTNLSTSSGAALDAGTARLASPELVEAFDQRIRIMLEQGQQSARLQLNPAELGALEIHLISEGDEARITITTQNLQAREMLEQQFPRLREALEQHGVRLGGSSVADGSAGDSGQGRAASQQRTPDSVSQAQIDALDEDPGVHLNLPQPRGQVDFYA